MEPQLQNEHPQQHKFKCGGIRQRRRLQLGLHICRHSPLSGNSNEAVRIFLYGNRPKWSPFANNFTGEIDTLALKRYCKSLSNPQKASTGNSPRKSTSRCAREAPLAEASRTKFGESPQATAAKGFPVNRRRAQPQTHGSDMDHISQGPDENTHYHNHSYHHHMDYHNSASTATGLPEDICLAWR
jgi:hypothetical protein